MYCYRKANNAKKSNKKVGFHNNAKENFSMENNNTWIIFVQIFKNYFRILER